jgi:ABC-type Na+ efflux pump permease subunit
LKLLTGAYLLAGVAFTIYERMRWEEEGDEMIEVALFLSAIATIVAASPVLSTTAGLQAVIGELLLCALASGLAMFARGAPEAAAVGGPAQASA